MSPIPSPIRAVLSTFDLANNNDKFLLITNFTDNTVEPLYNSQGHLRTASTHSGIHYNAK